MQYVRSESVVSRVIAGETLIIPVRKGVGDLASIYSLNQVATFIWQAIQQPRHREEIVVAIAQEFAIEPHQVERDVEIALAGSAIAKIGDCHRALAAHLRGQRRAHGMRDLGGDRAAAAQNPQARITFTIASWTSVSR